MEQPKEVTAESVIRNCKHGRPCVPFKLNAHNWGDGGILPMTTCGICQPGEGPLAFAPGTVPVMPERQSTEKLFTYKEYLSATEAKAVGYDIAQEPSVLKAAEVSMETAQQLQEKLAEAWRNVKETPESSSVDHRGVGGGL